MISPSPAALSAARLATCLVFLICGTSMAGWAPMVPYAKARLVLNDMQLGLVMLGLGGGAMLTMPLSGLLINRCGSRIVILAAVLLHSAMLPLLTVAPNAWLLGGFLFLFGCGIGAVDVAMNAQAVVVEQRMAKPIMSSFHGLFSVGGLIGAAGVSLLLRRGLDLTLCAVSIAGLSVLVVLWQFPRLLPHSVEPRIQGTKLTLPHGSIIIIGLMCFITFLAEGALLDWSAVFLKFSRGFAEDTAGVGYAAFSVAMAVGRLTGDGVVRRLGPVPTVRAGALVGALGYFLAVGTRWWPMSLVGFVLIGLGVANVVPLMFSAAGRRGDPGVNIPAITTLGYAGLLSGPALIGGVAHLTSLPVALGGIGVLLLVVAASARIVRD
jgi:predicted MFS family arabinose efflux permease